MKTKIGREKVDHAERTPDSFRVAMTVGHQCHHVGRMRPPLATPGGIHPEEFTQRQRAGVDAKDSGEFPDESPKFRSRWSISSLALRIAPVIACSTSGESSLSIAI